MRKIFMAIAAAALVSCGATTALLDDQSFNITELNGTEYVSLGENPAFISFSNGRCNASVGGNSIFAEYTEGRNGSLQMNMGGATRMLVPDEFREDEFIDAFNAISSFRIDGGTISFYNEDGVELIKAVK